MCELKARWILAGDLYISKCSSYWEFLYVPSLMTAKGRNWEMSEMKKLKTKLKVSIWAKKSIGKSILKELFNGELYAHPLLQKLTILKVSQ